MAGFQRGCRGNSEQSLQRFVSIITIVDRQAEPYAEPGY